MNHDATHVLSPLDKVIKTYKKGLQDMTSMLTSKLTEVKNVLSTADAFKQNTESTYLSLQLAIQEQAELAIQKVREQQSKLHGELKAKMELKILQCDTDMLKTARSKQDHIVSLRQKIQTTIEHGHALQFLANFKDFKKKVDDIEDLQLPSLESFHQSTALNLIPNENGIDGILGKLQECIVISDSASDVNPLSPRSLNPGSPILNPGSPGSPFINPGSPFINPGSPSGSSCTDVSSFIRCCNSPSDGYGSPLPSPNDGSSNSESNSSSSTLSEGGSSFASSLGSNTGSISHMFTTNPISQAKQEPLPALGSDPGLTASSSTNQLLSSPSPSTMAATHSSGQPIIAAAKFKPSDSQRSHHHHHHHLAVSSRKRLVLDAQHRVDKRKIRSSMPLRPTHSVSPPRRVASPVTRTILEKPRQIFKVDGVGGWPGKVVMPCSAAFLASGLIVVAEKENRLQLFDLAGQSKSVFGWGQVRPLAVTSVSMSSQILVTDSKDKCVKVNIDDDRMLRHVCCMIFSNFNV